jgi:hypothetical protein
MFLGQAFKENEPKQTHISGHLKMVPSVIDSVGQYPLILLDSTILYGHRKLTSLRSQSLG